MTRPTPADEDGYTHVQQAFDNIPPFDERAGTHYWVTLIAYHITDPAKVLAEATYLDHETMVSVSPIGCYYCEQGWSPILEKRRCKGHIR